MKFLLMFLISTVIGGCSISVPLGDCSPGDSLTWAQGPLKADIGEQAWLILEENGIGAKVQARNYGVIDSCGDFTEIGLDFSVTFDEVMPRSDMDKNDLGDNVYQILDEGLDLQLRSVHFRFPDGETFFIDSRSDDMSDRANLALPVWSILSTEPLKRNVYLLAYDPILGNGQKLSEFEGWDSYLELANDYADFFKELSDNRIHYNIEFTTEVNDVWLEKTDGFTYTEETYLDVIDRGVPRHDPDIAEYGQFLNNAEYDICGKLNRGEIDELWLFGGPWFGFNESRLAGPQGFRYNSEPYPGTTCSKLLPIMGFSYERSVTQMLESFGHRTEATLTKVYENSEQKYIWGLFNLSVLLAPNVNFAGCGIVHFPPNAEREYNYTSQSTVDSICDDFFNYPSLSAPSLAKQPTDCMSWGCSTFGFFAYWYRHIPTFSGVGLDGVSNDWWQYIIDPNLIQDPFTHLNSKTTVDGLAEFSFSYNGSTSGFYVDVSTSADMSADIFTKFAAGVLSPLVAQNPTGWDKYSPGATVYWRVTSNSGIQSPIQRIIISNGK